MADCLITGTLLNVQGAPVAGVKVYALKTQLANSVTYFKQKTLDTSDVAGAVSFVLPQGAIVWLQGNFWIGSTNFSVKTGVPVTIPTASSATLESFGSALSGIARKIYFEIPSEALDGVNQDYDVVNEFVDGTLVVTITGQRVKEDVDYTVSGQTVTTTAALNSENGDWISFDYETVASGRLYHQPLTPDPDGVTTVFTLPSTPANANDAGYKNGYRVAKGTDYTINGATITWNANYPPETGDFLEWDYD